MTIVNTTDPAVTTLANKLTQSVLLALESGKTDAKECFGMLANQEKVMREKAIEKASTLNGDERDAYLDGLEKGIVECGLTKGYAKRKKSEFRAVFLASDVSVPIKIESKGADGAKITTEVKADKDTLKAIERWDDLVKIARTMRKTAASLDPNSKDTRAGAGGATRVTVMKDDTFDSTIEELMRRTNGAQACDLLDAAITRMDFYYGEKSQHPCIVAEVNTLRELEAKMLSNIKVMHDEQALAKAAKEAVKNSTADNAAVAGVEVIQNSITAPVTNMPVEPEAPAPAEVPVVDVPVAPAPVEVPVVDVPVAPAPVEVPGTFAMEQAMSKAEQKRQRKAAKAALEQQQHQEPIAA